MTEEADVAPVLAKLDALLQQKAHTRGGAKSFLTDFAAKTGIPADSLNDEGMLQADAGGLTMMLTPLEDRPMVLATVEIDADLQEEPELARTFLEANLDWAATGGGTFASLGEDERPHLCRLIFVQPGETDAFVEDVAAMFNVASAWLAALDTDDDDVEEDENTVSNGWVKA